MSEQQNEEKFNIDQALNRLEEINRKLADKEIDLEHSLALYKEGTLLAAQCKEHLAGVEKELQILNSGAAEDGH